MLLIEHVHLYCDMLPMASLAFKRLFAWFVHATCTFMYIYMYMYADLSGHDVHVPTMLSCRVKCPLVSRS